MPRHQMLQAMVRCRNELQALSRDAGGTDIQRAEVVQQLRAVNEAAHGIRDARQRDVQQLQVRLLLESLILFRAEEMRDAGVGDGFAPSQTQLLHARAMDGDLAHGGVRDVRALLARRGREIDFSQWQS